jgi:putative ABC transport system ATP-binding protein
MEALIDTHEVTKRYSAGGAPALDEVSAAVAKGEAVAVMGPSGSGKSTLLNLVAGLDKPTSGTVTVAGLRIDTLSETAAARYRRRQVGMVFQFFNLLEDLTVADNVLLPAQLAGTPRRKASARAAELLDRLDIARYRDAYPGRLSGGERQRVAIARALINDPAVLLADEPTGAVDTGTGEEIGRLLLDLNAAGQTLVLVTHSPELAAKYAGRTVRLLDGRVDADTASAAAGSGHDSCDHGRAERRAAPAGADRRDPLRGAGGRCGRGARAIPGHQRERAVPRRARQRARRGPRGDVRLGQGDAGRAGRHQAPGRSDADRRALRRDGHLHLRHWHRCAQRAPGVTGTSKDQQRKTIVGTYSDAGSARRARGTGRRSSASGEPI